MFKKFLKVSHVGSKKSNGKNLTGIGVRLEEKASTKTLGGSRGGYPEGIHCGNWYFK